MEGISSIVLISYGLIPVAIAIAVLRYRLYEIDRIISRTVSYALVTAIVVAVYALVVTSVAWLLPDATTLGVALATLSAAAFFLPVLRVTRRLLDRRFNRAQYDAERVVVAFGDRLRTGADPHTAASDLADAVERTLEPSVVGVWTRRPTE
jgi:FlaA1/EpsC-like NDP-sugar epimerase